MEASDPFGCFLTTGALDPLPHQPTFESASDGGGESLLRQVIADRPETFLARAGGCSGMVARRR